jgi:hypothetical protein
MIKKLLLGIVVLYLLGASAGYLSLNWSDEWTLGELLGEAVQVGVAWPISVVEKMAGP